MKLLFNRISLIVFFATAYILSSCDKTKPFDVDVADPIVHFDVPEYVTYAIRSAVVDPLTIEVGTSNVSGVDRVITYNISSPTGAVAGTQYTTTGNTVTILAGKATANISIQGIFAGFPAGRKDTLILTLAEPSVPVSQFQDTVWVIMGDLCTEGQGFDINSLLGSYPNTMEDFGGPFGPYATSISSVTATGPTSGIIVVENIWDNGWGPISFNLDWSDPANLTAVVVPQAAIPGSDAGDINPAYAGQTIALRAHPTGGPGSFSTCNNTLTLRMQLGVTALGYFAPVYTVQMER